MNTAYSQSLRMRTPSRAPLGLALAAALGVAALPGLAQAATYTVTSTGDAGNGTCAANSCTLRDAVAAATSGTDTVMIPSTLSGNTITLDIAGKGHIAITHSLTIQGPGADHLAISGGNVAHSPSQDGGLFYVGNGVSLTATGITLAGGNTSGKGGALSFRGGNLTLDYVTIEDSHAGSFGGGFYKSTGTLTVDHSTISGNSAGEGGGFVSNYATTSLINSTVSGNSAGGSGGGFYVRADLSVNNSTISGNNANSSGGGFWINKLNGTLTNSIVAGNSASSDAEFICTAQSNGASSVMATNTLIQGSYACTGGGTFTGSPSNILGQDPKVGPLAYNGGPTQTLALSTGSPAIGAGNLTCETTDQRGLSRPQGSHCDMGAIEDTIFANGFE